MNLDDLYKAKGQLMTEIEVAKARLERVNAQIVDAINKQAQKPANGATPEQVTVKTVEEKK